MVMKELSSTTASSAWRRGLSLRVLSMRSRSVTLASTSSKVVVVSPLLRNSSKRRWARTSALAVAKTFISASGNTTVPMSRPSITRPLSLPMACCCLTIALRTKPMAAMMLTTLLTRIERM